MLSHRSHHRFHIGVDRQVKLIVSVGESAERGRSSLFVCRVGLVVEMVVNRHVGRIVGVEAYGVVVRVGQG